MTVATQDSTSSRLSKSMKISWAAVEESGVPDPVQKFAFREALRSLLNTTPQFAGRYDHQPPLTPEEKQTGKASEAASEQPVSVIEAEVLKLVSEETGVTVDRLEQVFHVDDGVVKLIGQHTKYGSGTAEQARAVAQIVTIVRKIGMGSSETSFEVIRAACESKHCYDSSNFASLHMPRIEGFVVKGEKKSRRLEARGPGIAAFPGLIDKVLGAA